MAKQNEGRVYKKFAKTLFNYKYFNINQVELLASLFDNNSNLFGELTH
jgi:hypothetical protein